MGFGRVGWAASLGGSPACGGFADGSGAVIGIELGEDAARTDGAGTWTSLGSEVAA